MPIARPPHLRSATPSTPPATVVAVAAARWFSLAGAQNGVPIVRGLSIELKGSESAASLEVIFGSNPGFIHPFTLKIDRIDPTGPRTFNDLKIQPNHAFLAGMTEGSEGHLSVETKIGGRLVATEVIPIQLLPPDQWEGLTEIPELLAAHVQPNHPFVGRILSAAGDLLKSQGLGLTGYQQQSREIVGRQIAAIYSSIRQRDLVYVNPPASFTTRGQRIRLPDQIQNERLATCLDLSVLFAACLEQAGLHPIVLINNEHAWLGCWLDEGASCACPVDDDGQSLRKRRAIGELSSLDVTFLTNKGALLSAAQEAGNELLNNDGLFQAAVDIRLARQSGIRPIPSRIDGLFSIPSETPVEDRLGVPENLEVIDVIPLVEVDAYGGPTNRRLDRWKRKLLDLSLRNRLINFKETSKTLRILGGELASLEDATAAHRKFGFEVNPRFDRQKDPSSAKSLPLEVSTERLDAHVEAARQRGKLVTALDDKEKLDVRLTEFYRSSRTAEEESGVSPLYLALGILEWRETERSTISNRAPILLIPVSLERSSVRAGLSGFTLSSRDEDTRVNPTLLEKLRRDFGVAFDISDLPPADDSGVDVALVMGQFKHLIVNRRGWEVKEEIWLGEFSFKKFLMWRDLQEREAALKAHPLVFHMLEHPHTPIPSQGSFPNPRELDTNTPPSDVYTPLVADSSQLAAIQAASDGKSFVLEGPPGTGKSQTITNLIAHCMAHGKTVLFISEKKAALEVVRRRLVDVGLGAYCLEVHSDKARKTEIIEQLRAPLEPLRAKSKKKWPETSQALATVRNKLNEYVDALHRRFPCGLNIYEATGWLCGHPETSAVKLDWGDPNDWTAQPLSELRSLVGEIRPILEQLGDLAVHALRGSALTDASPLVERSAQDLTTVAIKSLLAFDAAVEKVTSRLGVTATDLSWLELEIVANLAQQLVAIKALPSPMGQLVGQAEQLAKLRAAALHLKRRQATAQTLDSTYAVSFLECDLDHLETLHQESLQSWWPKSWLRRRALIATLRNHMRRSEGTLDALSKLPASLAQARTIRGLDKKLVEFDAEMSIILGEAWRGSLTSASLLQQCIQWAESLQPSLNKLGRLDSKRTADLYSRTRTLLGLGYEELRDAGPLAGELQVLEPLKRTLVEAVAAVHSTLQMDPAQLNAPLPEYLARTHRWMQGVREALGGDQLRFWAAWQRVRSQATDLGLSSIVAACESQEPRVADPLVLLEASICTWIVEEGLSRSPPLKNFIGQSQSQLIKEFCKIDAEYLRLASSAAAARVDQRIPGEGIDRLLDKEFALLHKELNKKARHRPLRQLFAGMPRLMAKMKPCLLMSPLSVAQHLDTEFPPFDLVVFDEASQIPVWDAIGAIARARQAVVVGDPKQMPPTAFFSRDDDGDEDIPDATEELESILDETMTTLPIRRLEWHYRSRYESLITFSNRRYYDGKLVTFPSPIAEDRAVKLHRIDGMYGRGTSRTNRQEAQAVVDFVVGHLRSPETNAQSIGVVTFNAQQQQLIDDLLDNARREDPDLEPFFAKAPGKEEVFIKNLENVQGDERDVIVFSTTFGLDDLGKMSMNFGPINSANGPRRLNVAITRSRLAMHVFTSIRPEQLDTARTTAVGVKHLKEFIDYAERGVDALHQAVTDTGDGADSPFEEAVASALKAKGWEVHYQIGCGGYRIDLGIVNPKAPGTYLAGVECDGASYHSGATARDRDRLRQSKLEDLGWKLHRVWSTEWWRRPRAEIDRLHSQLNENLAATGK